MVITTERGGLGGGSVGAWSPVLQRPPPLTHFPEAPSRGPSHKAGVSTGLVLGSVGLATGARAPLFPEEPINISPLSGLWSQCFPALPSPSRMASGVRGRGVGGELSPARLPSWASGGLRSESAALEEAPEGRRDCSRGSQRPPSQTSAR